MAITPDSGKQITLEEAKNLISNFKEKFPNQIKATFVGVNNINLILDQPDCIGIRVYYGYDTTLDKIAPVFVGVNSRGEDMTDVLIDKGVGCPTICDINSPLY